jgi:hypothetical protein
VLIVLGLVVYFVVVGWDKANKVAGLIAAVVAVAALLAPYVFPPRGPKEDVVPEPIEVTDSGEAKATHGGHANAGVETTPTGQPLRVERSGPATAEGPGSAANSGIIQKPRRDQ